jgi:hypothetical protein
VSKVWRPHRRALQAREKMLSEDCAGARQVRRQRFVLETLTGVHYKQEKMSEDCAGVTLVVRRQRFVLRPPTPACTKQERR